MIQKLRRKFIFIMMIVVTLILLIAFADTSMETNAMSNLVINSLAMGG